MDFDAFRESVMFLTHTRSKVTYISIYRPRNNAVIYLGHVWSHLCHDIMKRNVFRTLLSSELLLWYKRTLAEIILQKQRLLLFNETLSVILAFIINAWFIFSSDACCILMQHSCLFPHYDLSTSKMDRANLWCDFDSYFSLSSCTTWTGR